MKTTGWLVLTVTAVLAVGGVAALKAQASERALASQPVRGKVLQRAREKLGLTEDQVERIKSELKGERETLKSLISRLHEARVDLRTAIHASDATESAVREASAKVAAVEADLAVERLKLYGRINPILTAEQREKVSAFQAKLDDFVEGAIERLGDRLAD